MAGSYPSGNGYREQNRFVAVSCFPTPARLARQDVDREKLEALEDELELQDILQFRLAAEVTTGWLGGWVEGG